MRLSMRICTAPKVSPSAAKRALGGQHSAWEVLDTSVQ
jgi:hypothetical protein